MTPGAKLKQVIAAENPLQLLGILNPFMAMQLEKNGYKAAYLSGAGLSCFNYGLPDVGVVELDEFAYHIGCVTRLSKLPLLVDADTGFNDPEKTVQTYIQQGAAGLHIEDQTEDKRCGHLDGKKIVSTAEMVARIQAAVKGKKSGKIQDKDFIIMARTDALAVDGFEAALERIIAYKNAGADAIFAEAMPNLEQYDKIREVIGDTPLLANVTEYGKIDLYTAKQLQEHQVDIVLYPVSLARGMHGLVNNWMAEIKQTGTTKGMVDRGELRPRAEYNEILGYNPKVDNRQTVMDNLKKQ